MKRDQGSVIPAKAGIQANWASPNLDFRVRGNDASSSAPWRESHPLSYSVDIGKILFRFVVITFFTVNPQEASNSGR